MHLLSFGISVDIKCLKGSVQSGGGEPQLGAIPPYQSLHMDNLTIIWPWLA